MSAPSHLGFRLAAAAIVAAVAIGAAIALRGSHPPAAPAAPTVAPSDTAANDAAIEHALAVARTDSASIKARWIEDISGMDVSGLSAARREIFLRAANSQRCTCGCGYTLAGCRQSDMSCDISGPRLTALLDSVRAGKLRDASGLRARPRAGG
jgi:hypothetical protein